MTMPTHAIATLSDVAREGRMDARFHIALTTLRKEIGELRDRHSAQEAVAILDALPASSKAPMRILARGTSSRTPADLHTLAVEYPHLSLALVANAAPSSIEDLRRGIARSTEALDLLLALSETAS